jgi:hypothetical protein
VLAPKALTSRAMDFWLLGGISFVAWFFALGAFHFYNLNAAFDQHIKNWPYAFSTLALICNYPHFIASYRIAYGNGLSKITRHWFALIVVPAAIVFFFFGALLIIAPKN